MKKIMLFFLTASLLAGFQPSYGVSKTTTGGLIGFSFLTILSGYAIYWGVDGVNKYQDGGFSTDSVGPKNSGDPQRVTADPRRWGLDTSVFAKGIVGFIMSFPGLVYMVVRYVGEKKSESDGLKVVCQRKEIPEEKSETGGLKDAARGQVI